VAIRFERRAARLQRAVELVFECRACGLTRTAYVTAVGEGSSDALAGSDASVTAARAHELAEHDATRRAQWTLDRTPCPRCGAKVHRAWKPIALFAALPGVAGAVFGEYADGVGLAFAFAIGAAIGGASIALVREKLAERKRGSVEMEEVAP
jgi:hypothetical protein